MVIANSSWHKLVRVRLNCAFALLPCCWSVLKCKYNCCAGVVNPLRRDRVEAYQPRGGVNEWVVPEGQYFVMGQTLP